MKKVEAKIAINLNRQNGKIVPAITIFGGYDPYDV